MSAECGVRNAESRPVLVCFALKEEAGAFRKRVTENGTVSILVTGIGKENSRRTLLQRLDHVRTEFVLTCGFAGGLDPKLVSGAVIFSTEDSTLTAKLTLAGAKPAKFHCASRIATTVSEKAELRLATGADAVEMESEAIHQICRERGIPCATVRVISDTAKEDLPLDFNQLSKPDLSLDFGKLLVAIAKSPRKIPALLRLQKNCNAAAEQLAKVLEHAVGLRRPHR
jgi:adenosylhomocysteine nucleosidase